MNENKLGIPQFGRSHWTELGSSSQRERKKKTASFTFAAQQGAVKSRDISRVQSSQGVSDDLWCKPYKKKRKNIYDIFGYFFLSLCYHSVTNSFYQFFLPMTFWPLIYHWKTSLKNWRIWKISFSTKCLYFPTFRVEYLSIFFFSVGPSYKASYKTSVFCFRTHSAF